ncbi:enediyne biosynthesis protein [Nocardiopsis sinuspersici]|uniref:Enediyne biosynthesis protein n=1 Tax=Nocardiopsis sinuspersici TaxID=501010 RepID=A0A1V3C8M8_9ACTN|nr:enediyne biosynthesis protein [Nocardiopsis sinuspersici]
MITPKLSETTLRTRGFHDKGPTARGILEKVGASFLDGLGDAVETASPHVTDQRLEGLPARYRGFAYEGAAMGFALLDGFLPGSTRARSFIDGPGAPHVYMAYIGIGWAMARLPRPLWPDTKALDPLLRWLVHDGYGFHQAYFHTGRYVHRQLRDHSAARRTGDGPYALRAADQGIGRALWFVAGADAVRAVGLVDSFPPERRSDLWAGIGLAATYAGGTDEADLRRLCRGAGEHRWFLAQGGAFAAEARVRSGLVVPACESGTRVLCGMGVGRAARLCRDLRPGPAEAEADPARPPYESWRVRLAEELARHGGDGS